MVPVSLSFRFISEVKEYCLTESFEASCRDNEVVIMGMARFGRMELGRCVQKNYGNIGCQADVRPLLDGKCSGRTHCRFTVEDPSVGLLGTRPCPQDLSPFLQAAFRCERGQCGGIHDDVIKWKHFPRYWPFVWRIHRSPVNSPHKGQWRGTMMFPLICVGINGWINNR